jgi:hypothetical protein
MENNDTFPAAGTGARFVAGSKKLIGDFHDQFVSMIRKASQSRMVLPPPPTSTTTVVVAKDVEGGSKSRRREGLSLDTSTFTVCLRVRPLLGNELTAQGESFKLRRRSGGRGGEGK